MSVFFFVSLLLLLPLFNAENPQSQFDNDDELLMPRSGAANYLLGLAMRRYAHPAVDRPSLLMALDSDGQHQRGKRIYWENLSFQPADYNKGKLPKRS